MTTFNGPVVSLLLLFCDYPLLASLSFQTGVGSRYIISAARTSRRPTGRSSKIQIMADRFNPYGAPPVGVKAIIFDMDGTLLDTETLSDRAMYAALGLDCPDDYRLPWPLKQQILGKRGAEWAPIVLQYAARHWPRTSPLPDASTLCNQWEDHLNNYCHEVQACSGARELVDRLARLGLPMAIATSSRESAVAKKRCRHEDMFRNFPVIVCGDHPAVKLGKPAPDIYIEAARQLGFSPSECLCFEDALSGVRAGAAAGCRVVAIPDSRFDESERAVFVEEADVVLESLLRFDGRPFGFDIDMNFSSNSY